MPGSSTAPLRDLITATAFGLVEGLVAALDEGVHRLPDATFVVPVEGKGRGADADSNFAVLPEVVLDSRPEALGNVEGSLDKGFLQHDGELLATKAADQIAVPESSCEDLRDVG